MSALDADGVLDLIGRALPPFTHNGDRRWWLDGECSTSWSGCAGHTITITAMVADRGPHKLPVTESGTVSLDVLEEALARALEQAA